MRRPEIAAALAQSIDGLLAALDHLDPPEFSTYICSVAAAADRYEAEHKQDTF